ncbi:MAG TPA: helix-hairpin-helix domain-containing protein [Haliangiales bacterium]|nr:helix-hairpin-helix domain-containing protein [Haliangiales bacterium]
MLPAVDVVGYWLGIFLTFAILSYLYKDNPFYKLAEHLFVGVSIGYVVMQQYYNVLLPNLFDRLTFRPTWYWIPLVLVGLLFVKSVSRRLAWVGRYPLAFVVAFYAGIQINAVGESDLAEQIAASTRTLDVSKTNVNAATAEEMAGLPGFSPVVAQRVVKARAEGRKLVSLDEVEQLPGLSAPQRADLREARGSFAGLDAQASVRDGERYWFGIVSRLLLLVGLCASLVYFYFSIEHKGLLGKVSKVGVWVLMIGFGASFGYTVQGRLALAVGRAMDMLDLDKPAELARQVSGPWVSVVSIVTIIVGIVVWEKVGQKRKS